MSGFILCSPDIQVIDLSEVDIIYTSIHHLLENFGIPMLPRLTKALLYSLQLRIRLDTSFK